MSDHVSTAAAVPVGPNLVDLEKAFASLERACAAHDYQLQFLGFPEFDSLRSDPRFADLMRRGGLPQS